MIGMGFVKNWQQMAGLRVILGVLEAGFFPSCVYLLSTWYPRCEWITPCFFFSTAATIVIFKGVLGDDGLTKCPTHKS